MEHHQSDHHAGGQRNRDTDEILHRSRGPLCEEIETSQADGAAGDIDEARNGTGKAEVGESPFVEDESRRYSEGHLIGERVELNAEG